MDINVVGGSSALPMQKTTTAQKNKAWREASVNYYINFRYTNGTNLRSTRNNKIINYDLANGIVNMDDLMKICDPMGTGSATFSDQFMHHDMISPILHELLGEEAVKPDNALVYSEATADINRKQKGLQKRIVEALKMTLMGEIDPSTIDPNNPPPTPQEILKAERMTPSDIIESKANKTLKVLKKKLNTKLLLNQSFKDALIAGEEILWTGISNSEPAARRCNPINMTVLLDDSDVFIDDAIAVIEERLLTIPSILDEFGEDLTEAQIKQLEVYSRGVYGTMASSGAFDPVFTINDNRPVLSGVTPVGNYQGNNVNNYAVRVVRVEWMSMKKVGTLEYTDIESGEFISKLVDDTFASSFNDFKSLYPDAEIEWFWINEAWEGNKIGEDIYFGIRPKVNQRRRMDNPYYCKLGYTGFLYEATNSRSVSIVDRLKSYQYLRDIIAYKLQLVFASDIGKVLLMDMAQIPRSEGIDIEKWMYYLKEMKIAFVNSFEEGNKGMSQGKIAGDRFNHFTSLDLSLTQSVQQYINYLQYIDQQIYNVSGVNQQRMGKIHQDEAVTNVEAARQSSETITHYLFEAHGEVRRRLYESLIEVAKIAWRKGKVTQYVNDDLALEVLNIEEFEFENSDFAVFVSNQAKDKEIKFKLDQLGKVAMEQGKADLSTMIDTITNDSPKDIINILRNAEAEFYKRTQAQQEQDSKDNQAKIQAEQAMHAEDLAQKQADRDLKQYEVDANNATKIHVAEISALGFAEDTDVNDNMIPDVAEQARLALDGQKAASDAFAKQVANDLKRQEITKKAELEEKSIKSKEKIEELKIKQTEVQNKSQEKMQSEKIKSDEKIAQLKLKEARAKAASKPKSKPKK
jgi:hypothetical protein